MIALSGAARPCQTFASFWKAHRDVGKRNFCFFKKFLNSYPAVFKVFCLKFLLFAEISEHFTLPAKRVFAFCDAALQPFYTKTREILPLFAKMLSRKGIILLF